MLPRDLARPRAVRRVAPHALVPIRTHEDREIAQRPFHVRAQKFGHRGQLEDALARLDEDSATRERAHEAIERRRVRARLRRQFVNAAARPLPAARPSSEREHRFAA